MANTMDPSRWRIETRRRVEALVLFRSESGKVLLVKPSFRPDWLLPGGEARAGEPIGYAAACEVAEELGLQVRITHALAVDRVAANPDMRHAESLNVVCDGGSMTEAEAGALSLPVRASCVIEALAWVSLKDLPDYVEPFMEYRIRSAFAGAMVGIRLPLLYNGEPLSVENAA